MNTLRQNAYPSFSTDLYANLNSQAEYRIQAERMVLSTCFLDSATLIEHLSKLDSRDIYDDALRKLFELVQAMQRNGEPVTTQSVLLACSRAGLIDALGGPSGFHQLVEAAPNIAHAKYFRSEVQRLAKANRAYQAAYNSAIRLSHKDCDVEAELQLLHSLKASEPTLEESLVHCDLAIDSLLQNQPSSRCKITFGIPTLDSFVGGNLDCKWLVLIGARFGKGKSALACQLFSNAVQERCSSLLFSLEMTRAEILQRVVTNEMGIPMTSWRTSNRTEEELRAIQEFQRRTRACDWWVDDSPDQTVDSIRNKCELTKLRDGLDLVIIDNLQLIRSKLDSRQPRDVHFTTISKALKVMAKELDCCVALLCQLDAEAAKQRPTSANWASAKAIEGDADVAFMIHEADEKFEIVCTKNRHGQNGYLPIKFDGLYQRFESVFPNEYAKDFT
jgi:replicative DNA helicase